MTHDEFIEQYEMLESIYGEKPARHGNVWWRQFKDIDATEFESMTTRCIAEYKPFGQDRWPTPAQFLDYKTQPIPMAYRPFVDYDNTDPK